MLMRRRLAALLLLFGVAMIAHCAHALEVLSTLAQVEQVESSPRLYALLVVSSAEAKEQGGIDGVLELAGKAFPSLDKLERDLDGVATFAVVDIAQHKKTLVGKWNLQGLPALLVFKDAPKANPYTHKVYRSPMVASVDLLNQPAKLRKLLRDSVPSTYVREIPASELATRDAVEALVRSTTTQEQEQQSGGAKLVLLVSKQRKPSHLFRALATEFHDQGLSFAFVQHTTATRDTDADSNEDAPAPAAADTSALLERFGLSHVPALLAIESTDKFSVLADDSMANYKALRAFVEPFADKDAAAHSQQQQQAPKARTASLKFLTESLFERDVLGSKLVWIIAFTESDDVAAAVEASWQSAFDELQRKAGMVAVAAVDCSKEPILCERYGGAGIRVFPVALAPGRSGTSGAAAVQRGAVLPESFLDVDAAKEAALASIPSEQIHVIQSSLDLNGFVSRAAASKALPVVLFTAKSETPAVLKALALSLPTYNVLFGIVPDADPEVKAQFTIPATATTAFACLVMADKDPAAQPPQGASPFGVILYNKKAMGAYTYENMMHFLLSVLAQYPHPIELATDSDASGDDAFAFAGSSDGDIAGDASAADPAAASALVPYLQRDNMATLCGGNTICAIGFFDEHIDRLADPDSALTKSMRVLTQVAAASARSKEPFRFMWTSGKCQRAFADAFGVGEFQMPTVVVYAPGKRRYAVNVGTFTLENTRGFLQGVLSGKIGTAPVDAVPALRDECSFEELHADAAGGGDNGGVDGVDGVDEDDDADLLSEILQEEQRQRELLADELRAEEKTSKSKSKSGKKAKNKKSSKKSKKSTKKSTRDEL